MIIPPSITQYLQKIEKKLTAGDATEHTHRAALEAFIEDLKDGITATNEPKRIECGAPDFVIRMGEVIIGYIEAKDIGKSLDEIEKSEQLKRYRKSLSNLILTDYLEFRWYIDGEKRFSARLGTPSSSRKIKKDAAGVEQVEKLLGNFLDHIAEKVGTPKELALRMARISHMIRDLIVAAMEKEPEKGSLHTQLAAFRDNLIPDLSPEYFADMYAQTIAYGLFAARCMSPTGKDFTRQNAAYLLPKTNPFLRKLFNTIAGPDLDDRIAWLVDDLAQVLAQADMASVLENFGERTGKEDPVVHFYETFLTAYDPKVREMRGVYYTPEPVVSYIVRSIDHLLKTRFNKPQGLADENTLILDPATGTATFLYFVIKQIYESFAGQEGMWNDYVAEKLLKRIFGFELLMAPYAVAHLKLGLQLQETGYEFGSDQRLGIYLTNTLDEAIKHSETLFASWISEEANAAARVKKDEPIMVVLGNPPYSVSSLNRGEWIDGLLDDYKKDLNDKKLNLDDDYIKFLRFAQWRIEKSGQGIVAFITNNSYLDGPTHRRMREYLCDGFNSIYILNLHGNSRRKEKTPDYQPDQNVFDIQQGVAICILVKESGKSGPAQVYYSDLWGSRGKWPDPEPETKYNTLMELNIETTQWEELVVSSPRFFFIKSNFSLEKEYTHYYSIKNIFLLSGPGMKSERDLVTIHWTQESIKNTIHDFSTKPEAELKEIYNLGTDSRDWKIKSAKADVIESNMDDGLIRSVVYRPFDTRYTYYTGATRGFIGTPGRRVMQHILANQNMALVTPHRVEISGPWQHIFCVSELVGHVAVSLKTIDITFPLYLYPTEGELLFDNGKRRPNLAPEFIKEFSEKLGLTFIEDGTGDLAETFGPEDIFNYAYAIFHSPTYRTRYADFLKIDFPRLPLISDKVLFKALAEKGAELVTLHIMGSPVLNAFITKYPVSGSNEIDKISYDEKTQRVYINKEQYFQGVLPDVWEFHVGGYQVCEKWLKDRKGRKLTLDESTHYQRIVVALKETIRLMAEIEKIIEEYGGWPGAFT